MTTTVLGLVTLDRDNGLVRDQIVNTWHFQMDEADIVAECIQAHSKLQDFYETIDGTMSPVLTGDGSVRYYDLGDPTPRTPKFTGDLALVVDTSAPLPSECAIALSYQGPMISGSAPARRKGRIFLGPWSVDALTAGANDGLVAQATLDAITGAANTLADAGGIDGWAWAVFSPTTAGSPPWSPGELLGATLEVTSGHCDNAFDTIRSRGALPTVRQQW